jgi:hypothetical protein
VPAEVGELIRAMGLHLRNELAALPRDVLRWHPGPEEWCALEALGHLIETERRAFAGRIAALLERNDVRFESWDPAQVARDRRDCERDPTELIKELEALRAESVRLIGRIKPADLDRAGEHPSVGRLSVNDLLHEWVHHDRNHVKQIFTTVQAFAWPAMGNARKFSGE